MSITDSIKRILYRNLSLDGYLRVVSAGFFTGLRLGCGRRSEVYEYPRFLKNLVRPGDVAIDIGANLGYYSRVISQLVGAGGRVYAVEPVKPVLSVLRRNLRRCTNVEFVPFALGCENRSILMVNDSLRHAGYMGTGRNHISESDGNGASGDDGGMTFEVEMRRGSELFAGLERLDFIKCDIEGYETVVVAEMAPVIRKHLPVVLIESGGPNRRLILKMFREWGYAGYVLTGGGLESVMRAPEKDIVFIPGHRLPELKHLTVR